MKKATEVATTNKEIAFNVAYLIEVWGLVLTMYQRRSSVALQDQHTPATGMLMIPKTMAYVAIGFIAYYELYRPAEAAVQASDQPA